MSHLQSLKLAAIVYRPYHDVDGLLATFASDVICQGHRIGGIVQENARCRPDQVMRAIDLMTGKAIRISQSLGSGAKGCKLDPGGLVEAATAVSQAVAENVELIIVNKFGRREAAGGGLRMEIADAVVAGLPVLTAVPERSLDTWLEFTGGFGTTFPCERRFIENWWRDVALQEKRARVSAQLRRLRLAPRLAPDDSEMRPLSESLS